MRSSNNSRTPATDFVQDYAAKRQAQMDRARQLREERLHQQQQQQPSSPSGADAASTGSGGGIPVPSLTSPTGGAAAANNRPPPHAPRSRHPSSGHGVSPAPDDGAVDARVLHVKETDFKQATQAGIITPDQARQLWAMLSNQIIRVCPQSAQQGGSGDNNNAVSVSSLMALSNNSSASSNAGRDSGSAKNGFGASISLESLRTSIAFFKREQQRLRQQQQQGGGAAGGRPVSSPKAGNADRQQPQQQRHVYPEEDVEEDGDDDGSLRYEEENPRFGGGGRSGGGNNNGRGGGGKGPSSNKPAWNSDVDVNYGDEPAPSAAAAARKKARTGATAKTSVVRPAGGNVKAAPPASVASSSSARTSQQAASVRPGSSRAYDDDDADSAYAAPVRQQQQQQPPPRATAGGAAGRRPPAGRSAAAAPASGGGGAPLNLDDMPVGGGGGGMSDWANAYPPGMAPPNSRGGAPSGGGFTGMVNAPENDAIAAEAAAAAREPMAECSCCGRTFRVSVLARHEGLCRKQTNKPRKVFNMRDQRLDGVEGIEVVQKAAPRNNAAAQRNAAAAAATAKGKLPKWKVQHEQFQAAMKAVRNQNGGGFGTGNLAPPPAPLPEEYDDRVPCPHCGRKFAEEVATRHIPKCATTLAKPKGIRPIRR